MADRQDSDEIYDLAGFEPTVWLGKAQSLKMASQPLWDEMIRVQASELPTSNRSDLILAYMDAYLLLIGFAFENLIKGVLISQASGTGRKEKYQGYWEGTNPHKLTDLVTRTGILLDTEELALLSKLQTYTIWAGRYFLPNDANYFHSERGKLRLNIHDDSDLIEGLFTKLTATCR